MLEQLDEVAWASLSHAYGSAEDVPDLLRALASPDRARRERARSELYSNIFHQGTRWEATSYAVPFLLELCAAPAMPDRHQLIELVAALAIGYDEAWLPHGVRTGEWRKEMAGATGDYADALRWELEGLRRRARRPRALSRPARRWRHACRRERGVHPRVVSGRARAIG